LAGFLELISRPGTAPCEILERGKETMIQINKIEPEVAAIDIGSQSYFVAVAHQSVRQFGTFTADVRQLAEYLQRHGVRRVAMEATGVYWIPLHDYLDAQGFEVMVFNGANARNLPGRKTDVADCRVPSGRARDAAQSRHAAIVFYPHPGDPPVAHLLSDARRSSGIGHALYPSDAEVSGFDEYPFAQRDQPAAWRQWTACHRSDPAGGARPGASGGFVRCANSQAQATRSAGESGRHLG
jgi:hypothetical protein